MRFMLFTLLGLVIVSNIVDSGYLCDDVSQHPNLHLVDYEAKNCGVGAKSLNRTTNRASLADIPWLVNMRIQIPTGDHKWTTEFWCGATLINARYAVTSGLCIKEGPLPRKVTIDILEWKLNWEGKYVPELNEIRVEHIAKHQLLDSKGHNDIGLLRLAKTVDIESTEHVKPICLPWSCELQRQGYFSEEYNLSSAGWGYDELRQDNFLQDIVQLIPLTAKDVNYCKSKVSQKSVQNDLQICVAGYPESMSHHVPCKPDHGIPIMQFNNDTQYKFNFLLVGLVSEGPYCIRNNNKPTVVTRMARYLRWILDSMYPWTRYEGDLCIGNHEKC